MWLTVSGSIFPASGMRNYICASNFTKKASQVWPRPVWYMTQSKGFRRLQLLLRNPFLKLGGRHVAALLEANCHLEGNWLTKEMNYILHCILLLMSKIFVTKRLSTISSYHYPCFLNLFSYHWLWCSNLSLTISKSMNIVVLKYLL